MKDCMKPCITENDLDPLMIHIETNDVPFNKIEKYIAKSISAHLRGFIGSFFQVLISFNFDTPCIFCAIYFHRKVFT